MISFLFFLFYALVGCWLVSILFCVIVGIRAVRAIKREEEAERQQEASIQAFRQLIEDCYNNWPELTAS